METNLFSFQCRLGEGPWTSHHLAKGGGCGSGDRGESSSIFEALRNEASSSCLVTEVWKGSKSLTKGWRFTVAL